MEKAIRNQIVNELLGRTVHNIILTINVIRNSVLSSFVFTIFASIVLVSSPSVAVVASNDPADASPTIERSGEEKRILLRPGEVKAMPFVMKPETGLGDVYCADTGAKCEFGSESTNDDRRKKERTGEKGNGN